MAEGIRTTDILALAHLGDINQYASEKSNFTIISLHDANPDYINYFGSSFLSRLSKSSLCQDAIINKFYKTFNNGNILEEVQKTFDKSNEIINNYENILRLTDRKKFSYYTSLLRNSSEYFAGVNNDFGYALDNLNFNSNNIQNFLLSDSTNESFKSFITNCLGFNNSRDILVQNSNNTNVLNDDDIYSITENNAILSLIQLLNLTLVEGNNKSLTHSTNFFKSVESNDTKNYLTFNKRENKFVNTVLGSPFNSFIHFNYFDKDISPDNFNRSFNTLKNKTSISDNPNSGDLLETEISININTLSNDSLFNRHSELINLDIAKQEIEDDYAFFMESLLKSNTSITTLGILSSNSPNKIPRYRNSDSKTFMQSSNIEINNILFGTDNSEENTNLSNLVQSTKKHISSARSHITKVFYDTIDQNNLLSKFVYDRSKSERSVDSRIGITHKSSRTSILNREGETSQKDLFVYDNVDVFESNSFLTNESGYNYFSRGNLDDLNLLIEKHNVEKTNVESFIDDYYSKNFKNSNIYEDIVNYASEGVESSLLRLNSANNFDYGNLPIYLLEEVAFISRFTGNMNYDLTPLCFDQESFRHKIVNLFLRGIKTPDTIKSAIQGMTPNVVNKVIAEEEVKNYKEVAKILFRKNTESYVGLQNSSRKLRLGSLIRQNFEWEGQVGFIMPAENDFRRYAKDLNSTERESSSLISPRYFSLCGITYPDIYSIDRESINDLSKLTTQESLDKISKGFKVIYKPFSGFFCFGDRDFSEVNSFHAITSDEGILNQFVQEKPGIIKSFSDFLSKYLNAIPYDDIERTNPNIKKFVSHSFFAYCNIVISKLSQTFEYSTVLNAVKIYSEAPIDVMLGIDPKDFSKKRIDVIRGAQDTNVMSSGGFLGIDGDFEDFGGSYFSGDAEIVNVEKSDFGPSEIQKARSFSSDGYVGFTRSQPIESGFEAFEGFAGLETVIDEQYCFDNFNVENVEDIVPIIQITNNRRWLYPFEENGSLNGKIPRHQLFINYFDKSNDEEFKFDWSRDNQNQKSSKKASIENILNTLYYRNNSAKNTFLNFYSTNNFTDEIKKLDDENYNFVRASNTKFTGGIFHKEIFTYNSIEDENVGINDKANNNNIYTEDLIQEASQFLYARNSNIVSQNPDFNDIFKMQMFDEEVYISYWSQYNYGYPLTHKSNHVFNIYKGLVKKSYTEISNKIATGYVNIDSAKSKDAICNVAYKIYAGIFSEDLAIAYLLDSYRYAFMHMNKYKEYLETPVVDEETGEEIVNAEIIEDVINDITELVSVHYDDPDSFSFKDFITRINSGQNALIKYYAEKRNKELLDIINERQLISNNQNVFKDASLFHSSFLERGDDLKILCIGIRENSINSQNQTILIDLEKFDSINKVYSERMTYKFKYNYYIDKSTGNESNIDDYSVLEYDMSTKIFSEASESGEENQLIKNNHIYSFLAKQYLTIASGFGTSEESLKQRLDNTTANKSERPRIPSQDLENINDHLQTLNDDYIEMFNVSQNTIFNDDFFTNISDNVDFNVKNDVYTDILETNIKTKQDIYKRLLLTNYQKVSQVSLGEIYMPKEFTRVFYIPYYSDSFIFRDVQATSNNYSLKVNIRFE